MGRVIKAAELRRRSREDVPSDRGATTPGAAAADLIELGRRTAGRCEETRREVVDLALAIAERVIGRAVQADPGALETIYSECLEQLPAGPETEVRIHPEDRRLHPIDRSLEGSGARIVEDSAVGRGGCLVTRGSLRVDARIPRLLARIEEKLKAP